MQSPMDPDIRKPAHLRPHQHCKTRRVFIFTRRVPGQQYVVYSAEEYTLSIISLIASNEGCT